MPNHNVVYLKHTMFYTNFTSIKKGYLKIMYVYNKLGLKDVSSEEFKYGFCQYCENYPKVTALKDSLYLDADIAVCLL